MAPHLSPSSIDLLTRTLGRGLVCAIIAIVAACGGTAEDAEVLFHRGDFEQAFEVFSQRAEEGDIAATNFLGIHFYLGAGVERDFDRAAAYFEHAALENNADAQRNLAIMYMRGLGRKQDNHRAYGWFFQSYSGGNANSREYLQMLSDNVTPNAGGQARQWAAQQVRDHMQKKSASGQ